jgi:hypothetical protein
MPMVAARRKLTLDHIEAVKRSGQSVPETRSSPPPGDLGRSIGVQKRCTAAWPWVRGRNFWATTIEQ